MPALVRFMLWNFATGAGIGLAVAASILWIMPAGLGSLLEGSEHGPVAALLLAIGFGGTFGIGFLATALALDAS